MVLTAALTSAAALSAVVLLLVFFFNSEFGRPAGWLWLCLLPALESLSPGQTELGTGQVPGE